MEQKEQLEHPALFLALPLRCNRSAPLGTKEHQEQPWGGDWAGPAGTPIPKAPG